MLVRSCQSRTMHARITTARTRPGSAMYDADDNDAVTVTLWASDEEADEAAADLRPLAMSAFEGVLFEPPVIKKYEFLFAGLERAQ
jgi:hypothetical protein